ncbi:MAG: hypothetical protein Q9195_003178 [Heterodermia aff. obscurata]
MVGDGFTAAEVEATLHPSSLPKWQPRGTYDEADIVSLTPGPRCLTLMGRIVNFYRWKGPSKKPPAAKGFLKLKVKDDTGVIEVKLWYDKMDYKVRLGQLVSVWTVHISNVDASCMTGQASALTTSIFPENDNSSYFLVHEQSDDGTLCKAPSGYREGKQLPDLMTLKDFVEGGSEVLYAKILVCIKSIGGRKTFNKVTTKRGYQAEKVDIGVFDETFHATLQLWFCLAASASHWKPSNTILLLQNPGLRGQWKPIITVEPKTCVEVDPPITDATWLRGYGQSLVKREHVNPGFPEEVFDVETALTSERRVLFTIADIDQFCGLPLYANTPKSSCKHCEKQVELGINPKMVGTMTDETGSIACGKLIWSKTAWEQLLGRNAEELAECNTNVLKYMEHRLLFLRFSLLFGWSQEIGRLVICRVQIH